MRPDIDPALLTPHDRLREIAAILVAGMLRLRDRAALSTNSNPEKLSGTGQDCLEVSEKTVLSDNVG